MSWGGGGGAGGLFFWKEVASVVLVVVVGRGVETLNNIRAHRGQTNPQPCRIAHRHRHVLLQIKEVVRLATGFETLGTVCVRISGARRSMVGGLSEYKSQRWSRMATTACHSPSHRAKHL